MNLDNYIKTILSGIKTWAQSTFAKKSDVKDMYYDNRTYITTKEVTVNGIVGMWGYIKVADTIDFDINKVTHMSRYGNDGLYFTNSEVLLEMYGENAVDICVYSNDDRDWRYIAVYLPTQKDADIWFGDSYNNPFSAGLYMSMFMDEGDPCSVAYSFTYETGDFRAIDPKYIPEMPLATMSKAGAVHPWINAEYGQYVWMHPETGELFTNEIVYTLPVASYYTLGGVSPVAKTSSMTSNVGVDANGRLYSESSYVLPVATSTTLGGVKPISKTDVMTQEVGVDSVGKLYVMPSAQANWEEIDETSAAYIKNKPRIGMDYIVLSDSVDDLDHLITISEGKLTLSQEREIDSMKMISPPHKTEYMAGEPVDLTGISLSIYYKDGEEKQITDYYSDITYVSSSTYAINVIYKEYSQYVSVSIPISVGDFDPSIKLIDFEYTTNDDGTYTLTGWKGTCNGVNSTELIIPNSSLVIL